MNTKYFKKLRTDVFREFLNFFPLQEKINYIKINKKFYLLIKDSRIFKFFNNVIRNLKKYSATILLENNSKIIEEFLSHELCNYKINDLISWNELIEAVLFFLSNKLFKINTIHLPLNNEFKAHFYLTNSLNILNSKSLNLFAEKKTITKYTAKILADSLQMNKVENLCIKKCKITKNGLKAFYSSIIENTLKQTPVRDLYREESLLKKLALKSCELGDFHVYKILKILKDLNCENLNELDLTYNMLDITAIKFLYDNSSFFKLKKLILDENKLSLKAVMYLCNYLVLNKNLVSLSLLSCITNENILASISYIFFKNSLGVKKLSLNLGNFSEKILDIFFTSLLSYRNLKKLTLYISEFSNFGIKFLAKFLFSPKSSLKKLELYKIDFKFFFEKDFKLFAKSLIENDSLNSLSFIDCNFSAVQIKYICYLVNIKNMKSFKVTNFKFSFKDILNNSFCNLRKFTLSLNNFSESEGGEMIKNFTFKEHRIEALDLSDNPCLLSDTYCDRLIIGIIFSLKNLKKLTLKNNFISKSEQERIKNACCISNRKIILEF